MHRFASTCSLLCLIAAAFSGCGDTDDDGSGGSAGTGGSGGSGGTGGSGALSGAGGGSGSSFDAGSDASSFEECFNDQGALSNYDLKICDPQASECVFAVHQTDCCGNTTFVGLHQAQLAKFQACEAAWRATLPACGCPSGPPSVEQAGTVQDESQVQVECINCTTTTCVCMTTPK